MAGHTLETRHSANQYVGRLDVHEDASLQDMHEAWITFLALCGFADVTVKDFYK